MKNWKIDIIRKHEENATQQPAVMLRKAALECGYNHVKLNDCWDIIKGFLRRNPTYKVHRPGNDMTGRAPLFSYAYFSEAEADTLPTADETWLDENARRISNHIKNHT